MTNAELIDAFKRKFNLDSETDVAVILDVSTSVLGQWRTSHRPMPVSVKFRLLDHLGYAWARDALAFFVPEDVHATLIADDMERMLQRAHEKAEKASRKEKGARKK